MRELLSLVKPYLKKYRRWLISIYLLVILAAIVQTLIPVQISRLLDSADGNILEFRTLFLTGVLLLSLALLGFSFDVMMRLLSIRFAHGMIYSIRKDIFDVLQEQQLEFYSSETVGQIMSRTVEEVFSLRDILTWGHRITFLFSCLFVGVVVTLFFTNPLTGFIFILLFPVMILVIFKYAATKHRIFYNAKVKYGDMNQSLAENLLGIKTVKSFGGENEQIRYFEDRSDTYRVAALEPAKVRALIEPLMIFLLSFGVVLLLLIGVYLVQQELLTIGELAASILLVLQLMVPGRFLGWVGVVANDANNAAKRLNELFRAPTYLEYLGEPTKPKIKGKIEFKNVSFKYPNEEEYSLRGVNLTINPGEKIAIIGATGSGKSTLINLIPRFYDPDEGTIEIDGHDIRSIDLRYLREVVGIVHQDVFLFTLTVRENVGFARPTADLEEIERALEIAQMSDFIQSLEDTYDSIIGERGVTFSGGQRQRVAIARMLLQRPTVMIFDDAVSAIDPETEKRIHESIEESEDENTMIVISQRPGSLKIVDRIVVVEDGAIVQDGTYDELYKREGRFREFITAVNSQVKFMDWDVSDDAEAEADSSYKEAQTQSS